MKYLVDTNALWIILQEYGGKTTPPTLIPLLKNDGKICFSLPEVCAMEIYSVLGKYARGKTSQKDKCTRIVITDTGKKDCEYTWVSAGSKKLPNKEVLDVQHLIKDILNNNIPEFQIDIIPLTRDVIEKGARLLHLYSSKYDFHSLDATIAASAEAGMTIITYDKVLRSILKEEGINFAG